MLPCYVIEEPIGMGLLIGTCGSMSVSGEFLVRPWRMGDDVIGVATRDLQVGEKFQQVVTPEPLPDKRVVQCNFRVATAECREGARAYVLQAKLNGHRTYLLAKSRSGRWVRKWENDRRLTTPRFKTIPPEHAVYGRVRDTSLNAESLQWFADEAAKPLGDVE